MKCRHRPHNEASQFSSHMSHIGVSYTPTNSRESSHHAPVQSFTDFADASPSCPHPFTDPTSAEALARNAFYGIEAHPISDRNTRKYLNGIGLPIKTKEAISEVRRFVRYASDSTSRSRTPSMSSLLHKQNTQERSQEGARGENMQHALPVLQKCSNVELVFHVVDHRNLPLHSSMVSIIAHDNDSWMNTKIASDSGHVVTIMPDNVASNIHIQLRSKDVDAAYFGYDFETYLSPEHVVRAEGVSEIWLNVFSPPIMVCGSGLSFRHCIEDLGTDAPQIKVRYEVRRMETEETMTCIATSVDELQTAGENHLTLEEQQDIIGAFLDGKFYD
eukprot:GEMP01024992.1.p1 GENE.GEMP01024992.1~~GEMP01024992.1.p1  ORF type:complete len:331 (+),score=49.77 GEMP01024992.1:238-1230(+)